MDHIHAGGAVGDQVVDAGGAGISQIDVVPDGGVAADAVGVGVLAAIHADGVLDGDVIDNIRSANGRDGDQILARPAADGDIRHGGRAADGQSVSACRAGDVDVLEGVVIADAGSLRVGDLADIHTDLVVSAGAGDIEDISAGCARVADGEDIEPVEQVNIVGVGAFLTIQPEIGNPKAGNVVDVIAAHPRQGQGGDGAAEGDQVNNASIIGNADAIGADGDDIGVVGQIDGQAVVFITGAAFSPQQEGSKEGGFHQLGMAG